MSFARSASTALTLLIVGGAILGAEGKDPYGRDDYRADYEEACRLVAARYVALEEKTGESRDRFLAERLAASSGIGDENPRADFIAAMWGLRSRIADGHFDWSLPRSLGEGSSRVLGIIPTWRGGRLVVGGLSSWMPRGSPALGDEIIGWDGIPAKEAVSRIAHLMPQSSPGSTEEIAARMLELSPRWAPLHDTTRPVEVAFRRADGSESSILLAWRDNDEPLTSNGYPSLEEMPDGAIGLSEYLFAYPLEVSGKRIAILRPRAFSGWGAAELDRLLELMRQWRSDVLVVDLEDSAGGGFESMLELARFLGVDRSFSFTQTEWDACARKAVVRRDDFDGLTRGRPRDRQWPGELLVRTNPVCGSACDYFAAWIRLNSRGIIVGGPSAGRGIGTDDFELGHTGTCVSIPVRDRSILPEGLRIEGHPTEPDFRFEGDLPSLLAAYYAVKAGSAGD
jgi:Periplasmic protease